MSEYDRNKFYPKKKFSTPNKDPSTYNRSYYGRRSPSSFSKELTKETPKPEKVKQPTILLKTREHTEEASASPKRSQKEADLPGTVLSNTSTVDQTPTKKSMTKSVQFLDGLVLYLEDLHEFVQENTDFLVVCVVGAQGVGKSTILNLIASNKLNQDLKKNIFKNYDGPKEEEFGDNMKRLADNLSDIKLENSEFFKIGTGEDIETNASTTKGIDIFITDSRIILLDCQPFTSISELDELIQNENRRSSIVSEFIPLENTSEIQGLQLTAFLMSVCHVFIVVQDYFFDSNVVRFLQTAEMLKPTHSNPEDELNDYFPHLLIVQNKAQMEDFSPRKFKLVQEVYNKLFYKTKMLKDSNLGLVSCRLINYLNQETCGMPFNVFPFPEYNPHIETIYNGHPPIEEIIKKLRANILGAIRHPLTHVQLTEKTWLVYCSKVWENVKKSSFFVEYTKLMP